jgi:hypothetical protein
LPVRTTEDQAGRPSEQSTDTPSHPYLRHPLSIRSQTPSPLFPSRAPSSVSNAPNHLMWSSEDGTYDAARPLTPQPRSKSQSLTVPSHANADGSRTSSSCRPSTPSSNTATAAVRAAAAAADLPQPVIARRLSAPHARRRPTFRPLQTEPGVTLMLQGSKACESPPAIRRMSISFPP